MTEKRLDAANKNLTRKDSKRYFLSSAEQLSNWVSERTDKVERKNRRVIYGELRIDGILNEVRDISETIRGVFPSSEPIVIGNPSHSAISGVEVLMKNKGFNVYNPCEISVEKTDPTTSEIIKTTVGIGNEDGHIIYFGEEKNAVGEVLSRAVVDTGHSYEDIPEDENGYKYRLELHYKGGRYKESNAEIDIDSGSSPRATAKTLEILTNTVSKGIE